MFEFLCALFLSFCSWHLQAGSDEELENGGAGQESLAYLWRWRIDKRMTKERMTKGDCDNTTKKQGRRITRIAFNHDIFQLRDVCEMMRDSLAGTIYHRYFRTFDSLRYEVSFNKLRNTDLPGAGAGLAPDVPELQIWKWKCSVAVLLGDSLSNFHAFVSCFSGLSKSPHNKFFGQSASPDLWDLSPL